jgi:hypothetical protein
MVNELAAEFAKRLREDLNDDTIAEVNRRNRSETSGVCHSHDFCDANVAMIGAMGVFGIDVDDLNDAAVAATVDSAWTMAKANSFDVMKLSSPAGTAPPV